jgi:hypothetical protein
MRPALLLALVVVGSACAEVDNPNPQMVLPGDYRTAFVQVRTCRNSVEHGLVNVVVRVRAEQKDLYEAGPYPFPQGSLVVKEEYRDSGCTDLTGYTIMRKEAGGYFAEGGDWQWFTLDPLGTTLKDGKAPTCSHCHAACKPSRDFLCAQP